MEIWTHTKLTGKNIKFPNWDFHVLLLGFFVNSQQKTQSDTDWERETIPNVYFVGYFKSQTWVFSYDIPM